MGTPVPSLVLQDDAEGRVLINLDVLTWRFDCLEAAGFPAHVAIELSQDPAVDLHVAVALLERGASVAQALRILT